MPEKSIYTLTEKGEQEFKRLMFELSGKKINFFLDFNAVIVNLENLSTEDKKLCIERIEEQIREVKGYMEENLLLKENLPEIPKTGLAVLKQQLILAKSVEDWIKSVRDDISQ